MFAYGQPGALLGAATTLDPRKVAAGQRGEVATARLLGRTFAQDDDVYVFHDLVMPSLPSDHGRLNIDHVVVRGRRVVVLDSKCWRGGFYWTGPGRRSHRGIDSFRDADARTLGMAIDRLSPHLPIRARMKGLIVVWPSNDEARHHLWALRPRDGVGVCRHDRLVRRLRALLGGPTRPRADLLALFHSQLSVPSTFRAPVEV
ncbi:MAG: NERD domain-containing protein [Acidimicrobiia bacterium]|nr:NERD domain-containing protein [Acidimicrobiia bacterium]